MSRYPSFLAPTLACSTLLLSGALGHQAPQSAPPAPSLFQPQSPPVNAAALLDEVLALLSPGPTSHGAGIQWLSMNLWQKMADGESSFEASGRLVHGPNNRFRLEMNAQSQKSAKLCQVCDGVTFWETRQIGSDKPVLSLYPVPQETTEKRRFLEEKAVTDLRPLLERLRAGLQNPVQERGIWKDVPAIRISGDWQPNDRTPSELRAPLRPRACHILLEAQTRWPFRIEWWGSERPFDPAVLLAEVEFRDTVINQPPSPEEMSRLFAAPD